MRGVQGVQVTGYVVWLLGSLRGVQGAQVTGLAVRFTIV